MDPSDSRRDMLLGRLYDSLLRAQNLAELAGQEQMRRSLREMRRRVHAALVLSTPHSRDETELD